MTDRELSTAWRSAKRKRDSAQPLGMDRPHRKQFLFPAGSRFGSDNLVLHAAARRHVVNEFAGPLSIKTVVQGEVEWVLDGRRLLVDPNTFLVLGDGRRYSMNIDGAKPVETCCVFFRTGFVEEVAQD